LKAGASDRIDVTVILPALNEENTIGICISKIQTVFQDMGIAGEIIVSDSSTDKTPEIARSYAVTVIHPKSPGYGCAYREAFEHARGKYIIMGDADNTYDFLEIPLLLQELEKGADLVVGSRFKGKILDGAMKPLHRYIGNPLLTHSLNIIFNTHYSDAHSGFRAIRADDLEKLQLQSCGMEIASEMLIKASKEGLVVSEVPITYYPRSSPSKLASFTDGWRHLRFILLLKPIPFLAVPGIICTLFGIFLMAAFYTSSPDPSARTHSFILGSLLLAGGIELLFFGIIIKVYSVMHGYEKKEGVVRVLLNYHTLEKFLILGAVLIFSGLLVGAYILYSWVGSGFGPLNQITNAVLSLSLVILGLFIVFGSVLISMMCLNDETYSDS